MQVMVIIFITNQITDRSLSDPGLISWWRVKVERLLLLRVRTRTIASLIPMEVSIMRLMTIFQTNWGFDVR